MKNVLTSMLLATAGLGGVSSNAIAVSLAPPSPLAPTIESLDEVEPGPINPSLSIVITQPDSHYFTSNLDGIAGQDGVNLVEGSPVRPGVAPGNQRIGLRARPIDPNSKVLSSEVRHYYKGKQVLVPSEIASYHSKTLHMLLTTQINNRLEYYYFDDADGQLSFLENYPQFEQISKQTSMAKDLHEYSVKVGALEHYEESGEVLKAYQDYAAKYEILSWHHDYKLYDSLNAGAGNNITVNGPRPTLVGGAWGSMDNKAESYSGNNGSGMVFQGVMYAPPALSIVLPHPFIVNLPVNFRNNISSAFSN